MTIPPPAEASTSSCLSASCASIMSCCIFWTWRIICCMFGGWGIRRRPPCRRRDRARSPRHRTLSRSARRSRPPRAAAPARGLVGLELAQLERTRSGRPARPRTAPSTTARCSAAPAWRWLKRSFGAKATTSSLSRSSTGRASEIAAPTIWFSAQTASSTAGQTAAMPASLGRGPEIAGSGPARAGRRPRPRRRTAGRRAARRRRRRVGGARRGGGLGGRRGAASAAARRGRGRRGGAGAAGRRGGRRGAASRRAAPAAAAGAAPRPAAPPRARSMRAMQRAGRRVDLGRAASTSASSSWVRASAPSFTAFIASASSSRSRTRSAAADAAGLLG